MKQLRIAVLGLCCVLVACASERGLRNSESVTLLLNNGDKIKAQVVSISAQQVKFIAKSTKKAYEYGEVLQRGRIEAVRLKDGATLSLAEYDAHRKGLARTSAVPEKNRPEPPRTRLGATTSKRPERQFAELKRKPVSEMSDKEFDFFMMMLNKELQDDVRARELETLASATAPPRAVVMPHAGTGAPVNLPQPKPVEKTILEQPKKQELSAAVNSMVNAGLATRYLSYLTVRENRGERLRAAEFEMRALIRASESWRDRMDELAYLNRTAEKVISRVYLFNPEDLQEKLNLNLNPEAELDYPDLLAQIHRGTGDDVRIAHYRKLVDVFGEGGGRTIKELLERYDELQFLLAEKQAVAVK